MTAFLLWAAWRVRVWVVLVVFTAGAILAPGVAVAQAASNVISISTGAAVGGARGGWVGAAVGAGLVIANICLASYNAGGTLCFGPSSPPVVTPPGFTPGTTSDSPLAPITIPATPIGYWRGSGAVSTSPTLVCLGINSGYAFISTPSGLAIGGCGLAGSTSVTGGWVFRAWACPPGYNVPSQTGPDTATCTLTATTPAGQAAGGFPSGTYPAPSFVPDPASSANPPPFIPAPRSFDQGRPPMATPPNPYVTNGVDASGNKTQITITGNPGGGVTVSVKTEGSDPAKNTTTKNEKVTTDSKGNVTDSVQNTCYGSIVSGCSTTPSPSSGTVPGGIIDWSGDPWSLSDPVSKMTKADDLVTQQTKAATSLKDIQVAQKAAADQAHSDAVAIKVSNDNASASNQSKADAVSAQAHADALEIRSSVEGLRSDLSGGTLPDAPELDTSSFDKDYFPDTFSRLISWRMPGHSAQCPRYSMNLDYLHATVSTTVHCDIWQSFGGLLTAVFKAVFSTMALWIVLSA